MGAVVGITYVTLHNMRAVVKLYMRAVVGLCKII